MPLPLLIKSMRVSICPPCLSCVSFQHIISIQSGPMLVERLILAAKYLGLEPSSLSTELGILGITRRPKFEKLYQ